jgi:hypothetical protein
MATYKLLTYYTLPSDVAGLVTLSAIDQGYDDLVIYTSCRAGSSGNFNTGTDVNIQQLNGSAATFTGQTGYAYATTFGADTGANRIGQQTGNLATTGSFAIGWAYLANYTSVTDNKQFLMQSGFAQASGSYYTQDATYGRWNGSAAISSIGFIGGGSSFQAGSVFALYGIKRS